MPKDASGISLSSSSRWLAFRELLWHAPLLPSTYAFLLGAHRTYTAWCRWRLPLFCHYVVTPLPHIVELRSSRQSSLSALSFHSLWLTYGLLAYISLRRNDDTFEKAFLNTIVSMVSTLFQAISCNNIYFILIFIIIIHASPY